MIMKHPIYYLYQTFFQHCLNSELGLLTVLTVSLLSGCTGSVVKDSIPVQPTNKVVWADDASEVAVVTFKFDNRSGSSKEGATSPVRHQISVQNLDGSQRRSITQWRNYRVGQFFYMRQAGYLVVESLLENGAQRFDKIEPNGNEIMILETNGQIDCSESKSTGAKTSVRHRVIPSPNGLQLAHIYSPECGKVAIEFFHANNLGWIDTQVLDIDEPLKATWHPQGYVILANNKRNKAWKITASAPPEPTTPPNCLSPVTTSSDISLDGKKVTFESEQLVTKPVGRDKAFGCQS
jgi:hypothetical protein